MRTILYEKDIIEYHPYIDFDTPNKSFLRLAMVLKRMGIKNNYFFLSLFDKSLLGVDPHDPNLTTEQQLRISYESKINIWYWIREVVKIPVVGQEHGIPFQLNRGNLAAVWSFMNDVDTGLIMPRQTGKTYCTQVIVDYMMYVRATNLDIGMFTKDSALVQDNVARLKGLRDGLPKWMVTKSTLDGERKEGLFYAALHNAYKTFTSANDENGAYKLGRGATMALIHFDEIAFMNYNWIVVPTAVNSMLAASINARKAGMPSPIIFTTTAGNPETRQGEFALNIFQSALPFTEKLYDLKDREDLLRVIAAGSTRMAPMLYLEFSYRQLGKTDQWFEENASRSGASQDDIDRDFLNIWKTSSDNAILPEKIRHQLLSSRKEAEYTEIVDDFIIRWYIPKEKVISSAMVDYKMVMGSDSSENIGKDFTTFSLVSVEDMSVVATFRCNNSNTMEIARFITSLLLKYRGITFIPERQNTGIAITDFVLEQLQKEGINPYTRIYNDVIQNLEDSKYKNVNVYDFNNIPANIRGSFGYRTSGGLGGTSRSVLYKQVMFKALELNASRVYDRTLINEFVTLTTRGGRIDHTNGRHDDQVISYLLACYLIFFGKHLDKYNIDNSQVLSNLSATGEHLTTGVRDDQIAIRRRLQELNTLLSTDLPLLLRQNYIREINQLKPMLEDKLVSVAPMAVAQVNYEEQRMKDSGHAVNRLRTFTNRFLRSY